MPRTTLCLVLFAFAPAIAVSQAHEPQKQATYITHTDVQEVVSHPSQSVDQMLKIVDVGKLNLGVGVIHRGASKAAENGEVHGIAHHQQTETYIITSGSGTLVTGGTILNPQEVSKDSDIYKYVNGPSVRGSVKDGQSRVVGPGDIVIIPPDVFHGWSDIPDHVEYLSVRPDPDRVLPAGYVNPTLKK